MKKDILLEKQNILQRQANEVLDSLNLIKVLSKYGEAKIVGSLALGLMTWPDIDIDLKSKVEINDQDYFEIVKYVFGQENIKKLTLIDNRESFEKNRPRSMYLGISYNLNGIDWKIDIRYLDSVDAWAEDNLKQIKARLTEAKVKAILEIKTAFHNHPKYRREFSGITIYEAVLYKNISTVEEFKEYLMSIKIDS